MKVVIFAGGMGTRLGSLSESTPKPMVEIGGKPIIWHIMKHYSHYGHNEFIICAGYHQEVMRQWFLNYRTDFSDVTIDYKNNDIKIHNNIVEPWKVSVINTGFNTPTGTRLDRVKDFIGNETFMLTYGDAVSNVNIDTLIKEHKKSVSNGDLATITAVSVGQQFGILELDEKGEISKVSSLREKSQVDGSLINAGFMIIEPKALKYNDLALEVAPGMLTNLASEGLLNAYKHNGFFQSMDSEREYSILNNLFDTGNPPWVTW
jgi:glucose-1-phosphate cytidylyltransferase